MQLHHIEKRCSGPGWRHETQYQILIKVFTAWYIYWDTAALIWCLHQSGAGSVLAMVAPHIILLGLLSLAARAKGDSPCPRVQLAVTAGIM